MIGIETLKMYLMYLMRLKKTMKLTADNFTDAMDILAKDVWIGLQIEKVANMIDYLDDCCY